MNRKRTQTYICAISPKGAKHYLAVGETKLRVEDLQSHFTQAPTAAAVKALDGLAPAKFIWVELEQIEEGHFSASSRSITPQGIRQEDPCRVSGRDMRIGVLADIVVDEIRREQV